jgi:hypothetical protein
MMFVLKFGVLAWVGIDYQVRFSRTPLPTLAATLFLGAVCSLFFGIQSEVLMRVHYESRGHRPYAVEGIWSSHAASGPSAPEARSGRGHLPRAG